MQYQDSQERARTKHRNKLKAFLRLKEIMMNIDALGKSELQYNRLLHEVHSCIMKRYNYNYNSSTSTHQTTFSMQTSELRTHVNEQFFQNFRPAWLGTT